MPVFCTKWISRNFFSDHWATVITFLPLSSIRNDFSYFMPFSIQGHSANLIDSSLFKTLIKNWTECIARDYHTFIQMFKQFDQLSSVLTPPETNAQLSYFIEKMTDLCFRKGKDHFIRLEKSLMNIFFFRGYLSYH